MFDFVRTHNRLLQILLGLLIFPSFIFFGVQGYSRFMGPEAAAVATVDGHDITKAEWDAAHKQSIDRQRSQRQNLDPKTLDTPEARRATLDELVRDRVLQAGVQHQNLQVSDARLQAVLRSQPQYAMLLQADAKTREALLAQMGLTVDGFLARVRDDLATRQVINGVAGSALSSTGVNNIALDALLERREVQWQLFETKAWLDKVQPTEADLKAWYEDKSHAALLRAAEEAQIEYVVLDLNALKGQVTVGDKDLKDYYEANINRFKAAEERRASHILVKVDPKAPQAEIDKAKAKAESLLEQARKAPAGFAELAKKNSDDPGSAAQGGDLEFFGRGAMTPPFDAAVFAMKQGEISNLVKTDFGFHIIQLTGVRGGVAKPFEEVRPQLEDEVRKQLAQKKYAEVAEQFTNMVYEQADSFQNVVDKLKLSKQTTVVHRQPEPGAAGVLASARLLESVFSADSVRSKHNTEAVEASANTLVSARILKYTAEHQRSMDEVKPQLGDWVKRAMAAAAARKDGEARLAALRKDANDSLPQQAIVSRTQMGQLPRPVLDAALKADLAKGPVVTGVGLGDDGYVALRVLKSLPRDAADAQTEGARQLVQQQFSEAETLAYFEALKARYKAKLDEAKVAKSAPAADAASAAK